VKLALAVAALGALIWTAQSPGRAASCHAGIRTSGGATYRTFCGPARATVHLGGRTYRFTQGSCLRTRNMFTINIGTITLPPRTPKYNYFGITIFTGRDGTFREQSVAMQFAGGRRGALFHTTIRLSGRRQTGSFSGTVLATGARGTGTFSCG